MAQWDNRFTEIMERLEKDIFLHGGAYNALHALALSWMNEDDGMLWLSVVPGNNVFGADMIFVNDEVLTELQWSFAEWQNGSAQEGIVKLDEREAINMHLEARSSLPLLARLRRKNLPKNQDGSPYILNFHHNLPYGLRVTVGRPVD